MAAVKVEAMNSELNVGGQNLAVITRWLL